MQISAAKVIKSLINFIYIPLNYSQSPLELRMTPKSRGAALPLPGDGFASPPPAPWRGAWVHPGCSRLCSRWAVQALSQAPGRKCSLCPLRAGGLWAALESLCASTGTSSLSIVLETAVQDFQCTRCQRTPMRSLWSANREGLHQSRTPSLLLSLVPSHHLRCVHC